MSLYLLLNILTVFFPLLRAFEPRVHYARHTVALLLALSLTALWFIPWDVAFTAAGVWGFEPAHLLGVYFLGLPLEEWLFFFCIPYASVFIYACVCSFVPKPRLLTARRARYLCVLLAAALLLLAFSHTERSYTFWNGLFAACWLLFHGLVLRKPYLPHFFLAYLWHLIPFVLINGVLTGAVTERPVVWYNDAETLGLRFFTIPAEDFIYSLLLLLMAVTYYEFLKDYLSLGKHRHEVPLA